MNRPRPSRNPFTRASRVARYGAAGLALLALTGSAPAQPIEAPPSAIQSARAVPPEFHGPVSGIDIRAVDYDVRPQDDFFHHVNGAWLNTTEIPADKSRYGMFDHLADETDARLRSIINDAAAKSAPMGSNAQKLGDMYASYMDLDRLEKLGTTPIAEPMKRIEALSSKEQAAAMMGELMRLGVSAPMGFYVYPDARQPQINGFWLYQSGLSLPDRDYYLNDEEKFKEFRSAFQSYAQTLLGEVGHSDPQRAARNVLELETAIAERHLTRVESRDAEKNYNKRSREELVELLGAFPWEAFAQGLGAESIDAAIVRNLPYFESLGELYEQTELQVWKDYLAFRLADASAPRLTPELEALKFGFYGTTLNGTPKQEPRWKRGVQRTSGALGELLGQEYVARHFRPEAKQRMEQLVDNLVATYAESIHELEWMSDETKEKALEKLSKFTPKIGYPDKWRDYSDLEISAGDYFGNVVRSAKFDLDYDLARAGKPIDPDEWSMTPQTVNAYYSPTRNEIVFPAGILQPPFFNMEADDAVNYGGIGGVIGHEIGHGFDDQGSKYGGDGHLQNWWTESDREAFDALGDRLAAQYDEFSPIEGMNVNGRLSLGENSADLAGVAIAYRAYQRSLEGAEPPVIDSWTGSQRFFMGWAQVWRTKYREDAMRQQLIRGPHSPAEYRVIGPLRNVEGFYTAFDVKEGDGMWLPPEERVRIW